MRTNRFAALRRPRRCLMALASLVAVADGERTAIPSKASGCFSRTAVTNATAPPGPGGGIGGAASRAQPVAAGRRQSQVADGLRAACRSTPPR